MPKHWLVIMIGVGLALSSPLLGQGPPPGRGDQGWGPASRFLRLYDTNSVVTVTGTVAKVEHLAPISGMGHGVHLQLQTATETLSVHLGPAWFIDNQETKIEPQDQVVVTGSRVMLNAQPAIIAAEVRKGDDLLVLRDAAGIPAWAGWRHRSRQPPVTK